MSNAWLLFGCATDWPLISILISLSFVSDVERKFDQFKMKFHFPFWSRRPWAIQFISKTAIVSQIHSLSHRLTANWITTNPKFIPSGIKQFFDDDLVTCRQNDIITASPPYFCKHFYIFTIISVTAVDDYVWWRCQSTRTSARFEWIQKLDEWN